MAKFQYRRQNILDIKSKLEIQAKNAYTVANNKYMEEQQKLQQLIIKRMGYEKQLKEAISGNIDIKEVNNARNSVNSIKVLVRRQMMEVHKAELNLERARQELNQMMVERKTHEKLKEKAFEEFKKDMAEQESKEIDELVSYVFNGK